MSHKALDFHSILWAAEIIKSNGKLNNGLYLYQGFTLNTGYDGYSITVSSNTVDLTINFHNTFNINSPSRAETERFLRLIKKLCDDHDNS